MGKGKENGAHHRRVAFYSKPSNLCVSRPRRMDLSLGVSGIAMDDHNTSRADPTAELRQLKSTLEQPQRTRGAAGPRQWGFGLPPWTTGAASPTTALPCREPRQ